jgi:hypothetical protein
MMRRALVAAAAAACAILAPTLGAAATQQSLEQKVKAAFLPKFARYIVWPSAARPPAGAPLTLCIVGPDPFGRLIDEAVAGQQVDQNPIEVRRVGAGGSTAGCHMAFVHGATDAATRRILDAFAGTPVLTVTDARDGDARGMIHFALSNGRVGFHVDDAAAARSRLSISSRLLGIALSVRQRGS